MQHNMSILGLIFQQGKSSIGGLVIDATTLEQHTGSAEITENPVEEGAQITDHVQIKPTQLIIEGIISDTPLTFPILGNVLNIVNTVTTLFGATSRSVDGYNKLVELKEKREPFDVITGLKRYENMVVEELTVTRTATTGQAISFRTTLRNIRIVSSKTSTNNANLGGSIEVGGAGSIKDLGSQAQDLGKKATDVLPVTSPISAAPSSTVSASKSSTLFQAYSFL